MHICGHNGVEKNTIPQNLTVLKLPKKPVVALMIIGQLPYSLIRIVPISGRLVKDDIDKCHAVLGEILADIHDRYRNGETTYNIRNPLLYDLLEEYGLKDTHYML